MNQAQNIAPEARARAADGDYHLVDFLIVLAKHKKIVLGLPAVVALAAVAVSLLMPNVYMASAKLLPPQQSQSGAMALLSQLGSLTSAAGLKAPNDLYIGMLKSRTLADTLVAKYDLKKVYDTDSLEKARKALETNTVIASGKDGLITIAVEDEDRGRVAQLANSYVEELVKLTKVLAVTEASQRRLFFERQLELAKNNLATAEMALKGALDTHGVISVDADSRAIVETVGRLRAQISAKEIQINAMRAFVTTSNPEFQRAEEELSSARGELSKLENGRPGAVAQGGKQVGLENIKILRDVKYYQMLYELLAKQYEVARLDEAKDPSIIQVLDPAVAPERKVKPRRALIVLGATMLALFVGIFLAFVTEARRKSLLQPQGAARWIEFKSYLRKH